MNQIQKTQKINFKIESSKSSNFFLKLQRNFELKVVKTDIFELPDGQQVYIPFDVRQIIICDDFDARFEQIMQKIDSSETDKKMVPVTRVGAGPTEKSAKFSVVVVQSIMNHEEQGEKEKKVIFTLPVSQIEKIGDQLAAPLWIILEKLKTKQESSGGSRARARAGVNKEFVPATLRAATSPRVIALKKWLTDIRDEMVAELDSETKRRQAERDEAHLKRAHEDAEKSKIADELFLSFMQLPQPVPRIEINKLRWSYHKLHGPMVCNLFFSKAINYSKESAVGNS